MTLQKILGTIQVKILPLLIIPMVVVTAWPATALAAEESVCPEGLSTLDCQAIYGNWQNWIPQTGENCSVSEGELIGDVNIDQLLRTIAHRESGGDPKAEAAGSTASGKYQYIDGTWRSRASMYSEVSKYPRASDAPEAVQDAVAFLEYSQKIKIYDGDLFKIALSHFYPAAISDPSLLDNLIGSNSITPRQYADAFVEEYAKDVGHDIKLYYTEAPNLPAAVPAASGVSTSGETCTTDTGDLGVGQGDYTDGGEVRGFANVLANAQASDREFGDNFVGCNICAAVVSRVWRGKDIGYGVNYANQLWHLHKNTVGHADRNPKKGAILIYNSSNPAGHVVIYLGNNKVLNDGKIMDASFEKDWNLDYLGWIDPNDIGWVSTRANNIRDALASKLSSQCN